MSIMLILFIAFLVFIVILIIAAVLRKNPPDSRRHETAVKRENTEKAERRGHIGEETVVNILKEAAGENAYVFNDYLFKGETITVQIDHILVNPHGVFVIETKNYSGELFGSEEEEFWTQRFSNVRYSGGIGGKRRKIFTETNKIRNPIKQNAGHIYQLSKIMPKYTPFFNVIVLVQGNK